MSQPYIVADTEDNSRELLAAKKSGFEKKVTQIAALTSDGDSYYSKGDVLGFLRWLHQKSADGQIKCYFHNLRYDLGNLFGRALDVPDVLLLGGRIISARWRRILFHDSFNIWVMSVKRMGEVVGLPKLDFDSHNKAYVYRDCEIVLRALQITHRIAAEFGLEKIPATTGSLAQRIWAAMGGETWFCDYSGCRTAYYGGRVELFRPSAYGEISYLDINSLYPWAMSQGFPTELVPQKDLDCEGIAAVVLKVPQKQFLAPLPVRREDESIYYPTGTIAGIWTTYEIRKAIAMGATVKAIGEIIGSKNVEYYYRNFVLEFYNRRFKAKTEGEREYYKRLLNAFYGHHGMIGTVTRSFPNDGQRQGVLYGSKVLCDVAMPLPDHVNYLHAAYITSMSRVRLLEGMEAVPSQDLIYCDTDSIIHRGLPAFPPSRELGAYKLVATWDHCICHAPKMYEGPGMVKAKGVPQRLAREFIDKGRVEFDQPFGLREAITGYDMGNCKQLSVWRKVEKQIRTHYDKKKLIDGQWYPLIQR